MKSYKEAVKSAEGWQKLLIDKAKSSYSMEIADSSMKDLADTLAVLLDYCTKKEAAKQPKANAQSAQTGAKNAVA